jgi:hypothetical protein
MNTPAMSLLRTACAVMVVAGAARAHAPEPPSDQPLRRLDTNLRGLADFLPRATRSNRDARDDCENPAVVYLETGSQLYMYGEGALEVTIHGTEGIQEFTFASATAQADIISAINTFTNALGVVAEQSPSNPDRVAIRSVMTGADAFVSLEIFFLDPAFAYTLPKYSVGTHMVIDWGGDGLGADATCDGMVNAFDFFQLLQAWGPCEGCAADLSRDGEVDITDFNLMLRNWGSTY